MADSNLPTYPDSEGENNNLPEVRLELTQAGVRQVMSLYAEEQAGRGQYGGISFGVATDGVTVESSFHFSDINGGNKHIITDRG